MAIAASATSPGPTTRWRATKRDGIGHAFTGKGPAMCGEANQEERYDWPRRNRCVVCDERLLFLAARP